MANLIEHNLSFSKESAIEFFLKPIFVQSDLRDIITLRTDIKNNEKLDLFDALDKITKPFAQGSNFTSAVGVTITQRTITVVDLKAEVRQNGKAFLNQVKQSNLFKATEENNISGTIFEEIIMEIYTKAISRDLQRQLMLGDTTKELLTAGAPNGTLDEDYKEYDGLWTRIINAIDSSEIPSGQFVDINTSTFQDVVAIKEKITSTLTGSSGDVDVIVNGTTFALAFNSSLTQTAADFVTANAATIAAKFGKVVVTSSTVDIIFESGVPGLNITVVTTNTSGDLDGSEAETVANVQNTTLKTDAALTMFKQMWTAQPNVLRGTRDQNWFVVTASIHDNYTDTIETLNGSDAAHRTLIDGVSFLSFRGVAISMRNELDEHIENDFDSVRPHRAWLALPSNMIAGVDGASDELNIEAFYDKIEQENIFRAEYKMGTQFVHPDFIVAAF